MRKVSGGRQSTSYLARNYAVDILRCFGVDVRNDDPDIHPTHFCNVCKSALNRFVCATNTNPDFTTQGGCGALVAWSIHKRNYCSVCDMYGSRVGRPSKKKKMHSTAVGTTTTTTSICTTTTGPACTTTTSYSSSAFSTSSDSVFMSSVTRTADAVSSTSTDTDPVFVDTSACDIDMDTFLSKCTPLYTSRRELCPDRLLQPLPQLVCGLCHHIADQATETPCCSTIYCGVCMYHWLDTSGSCPSCHKKNILLSAFHAPHPVIARILAECVICCDFAGATSLEGCPTPMPLHSLKAHCAVCPYGIHGKAPPRVIVPSSSVADVMQAPASMLQGDISDKLLSHLINNKSISGELQQRTGRRPILWRRVTSATTPTGETSARTNRRREAEIESMRQNVCGGVDGSALQKVHAATVMGKESRELLLKEAGIRRSCERGVGLAIKADLQLPWLKLRKLRRYMKEFGIKIESESTMRKQITDELPFPLISQEVPLLRNGEMVLSPVVRFENLVDVVLHYLDLHSAAGTLVWHDGAIPEDEIWVKVGGDHGGQSFKFSFQICNTDHPNSLFNTVPFLVFGAKDLPTNLATTFEPYSSQLQELEGRTWSGKTIRLSLFGDYEFLTNFSRSFRGRWKTPLPILPCH